MIFKASSYLTRGELEKDILSQVAGNEEANRIAAHEIIGSFQALKRLQLSEKTVIYGIKCRYTSGKPKEERPKAKVNRSQNATNE